MFISFDNHDIKTEAYINIRPNSRLESDNVVAIIKEGYKKAQIALKTFNVTYGIIPDREIVENIKKYVGMSHKERIKKIYQFIIAKGEKPINGEDSKLIKHIELKKSKHGKINEKNGKINHRDLGFSERIVPLGSKIISIIKPTKGEPGIDIKGEKIHPVPGKMVHKIKFDEKSIEKTETENEIILKSKKEGFLYEDPVKGFFIDEKVLVPSIDFNIGNIEGKKVSESSVIVNGSTDILDTAVKPGFKVEAKNINIKGNVGSEAIVNGEFVSIHGVADKNSVITGKVINIEKSFNNNVKGEKISVKSCNSCEIYGNWIYTTNSVSTKFFGSEIVILKESRGSFFTTDKFVFINNVKGKSKQSIVIDPLYSETKKEELEELTLRNNKIGETIDSLKGSLAISEENIKKLQHRVENIISKYFNFKGEKAAQQKALIKNLIFKGEIEFLESKFQPDFASHDIDTMKKISKEKKETDNIKKELEILETEFEENRKKIKDFKESYVKAKIIIMSMENEATIDIKNQLRKITLNHNLEFPLIVHYENSGLPKVEAFSEYKRKNLKEKLYEILNEDTLKYLKRLKVL